MDFELSTCDLEDAALLTEYYNQQIADMPFCYPVTQDEFTTGISHDRYEDVPPW